MSTSKRAVARHACLACREKKVKCDGEVPVPPGEKQIELKTQRCTNCKTANIQCIFVRSQRGGRRKKDQTKTNEEDGSHNSGIKLLKQTSENQLNSITADDNNNRPVEIISSYLPPNENNINSNNIISSIDTTPSPNLLKGQQQQQVRPTIQRDSMGPQSQLNLNHINNDYYQPTKIIHNQENELLQAIPQYQQQLNTNPALQSHQLIQNYSYPWNNPVNQLANPVSNGTVPLQMSTSISSNYSYQQQQHQSAMQEQSLLQQQHQPSLTRASVSQHRSATQLASNYSNYPSYQQPQKGYISVQNTLPNQMKRSFTNDIDGYNNATKLPKSEQFIEISNIELEKFELPNWKTTCVLIDLYYRYIHPSRPFLPSKSRIVYQLQVREDASLLHAMFSCSSRYASNIDIPDPKLRDPQHWYFLAEKYWDLLDLESSLQALVLLMGALGPGGYVQQSIEGSEKFQKKLHVNGFLQTLYIKDWKEFASCATKKQVIRYEDMLRTVWGSWKLNVFLRINRGFPFKKVSETFVEFLPELPFPLSDDLFNSNLDIFDSNNLSGLLNLEYKSWKDFQIDLKKSEVDKSIYSNFTDSSLIIIAIKTMEDIMDAITTGGSLNSSTISYFNYRIQLIENITNSSLYHVSQTTNKKLVAVNISKMFALLILTVAKLVTNVTQCAQILFIKPHETNSNSYPDDVFNSLYESKLETINEASNSLTQEQLYHYFTSFNAALEAVRLIEIGVGIIPEESGPLVPATVVGGPSTFTTASEISSMNTSLNWWLTAVPESGRTLSAQVQTFNEFPDAWIQYPVFSVVVIANALTILSSSMILTKFFTINELSSNDGKKNIEVVVNGSRVLPIQLNEDEFQNCIKSFDIVALREKIRLCSSFIRAHGKYWAYVEAISNQAEAIISHIDKVIASLS